MKYLLTLMMAFAFQAKAADSEIAYVDLQQAIQSTAAGKKARNQLEKEFKAKEKDLKKQESELKKMGENLQKKAALLSEDAKRKQQGEFQRKMMEFRQDVSKSQQEIAEKERKMTAPILEKMQKTIAKIAEKKGYTMVLERRDQNILWAKKSVDITDEVVKAFGD